MRISQTGKSTFVGLLAATSLAGVVFAGTAAATPSVSTEASVVIDVGGTWDMDSSHLKGLIAPFAAHGNSEIKVSYLASGFDLGNGIDYNTSRTSGEVATTNAIKAAVVQGPVVVNSFSQGADAAGGGIRVAVAQGVDPSLLQLNAVASPDQPITGLRNRIPFDLPGIAKATNGNTAGVATNWTCIGHELVCNAPSDLNLVKWANSGAEYWLTHAANGRCNYATPENCVGNTTTRVEGNQTFTTIQSEAGLIQMADNAHVPLPEPIKEVVRAIVNDDGPAASTIPLPTPVDNAHAFVDNAGLDQGTSAALNNGINVIAGIFGQ
jgi:hypothetical protein